MGGLTWDGTGRDGTGRDGSRDQFSGAIGDKDFFVFLPPEFLLSLFTRILPVDAI